jgi:hypothetical protein
MARRINLLFIDSFAKITYQSQKFFETLGL